jgi:hypothetical protein
MLKRRRLVGIGLLTAAALALAPAAGWARPTAVARYVVTFKLSGHYSWQFTGLDCCGYSQSAVADWHYQERFGPVPLFTGGTHHASAHTPSVSGSWTETFTSSDGTSCSRPGTFTLTSGDPALKVTPGFEGGSGIVMHGSAPEGRIGVGDSCGYIIFDGCAVESVYQALKGHSPCNNSNNKYSYFPVHLSVTKTGLRAHHGTYHVSNASNPGEHVDPTCNVGGSAPAACSYTWSGTVSFSPA